jgi:hypothetical protein
LEAREDLILEELTMENRKDAPAAALAASNYSGLSFQLFRTQLTVPSL